MPSGPHRFQHGEAEVVVLSDGFFPLTSDVVAPDASPGQWADIEGRMGGRAGSINVCVNVPVIRSGRELVVVDVGGGGRFQPTEGRLSTGFVDAGFDPFAVTRVLLTHAHPDHIWGALHDDGRLRFPNATYYISASEWDFWSRPDVMDTALAPFARGAQRDFDAIRDRVIMLHPGSEPIPGVQALGTPGHTPGHLSFVLQGRDPLVIAGDAVTNELTSIEHPTWRFGNDVDAETAIKTRLWLVEHLAATQCKVLAAHFAYPGVGIVERRGSGFCFATAA